ncbi:ABC transporter substrate-binding protein [Alkalicoccobacillus gibsonii]|uniref:ABC transporter substrate-binding protein n=1 Tax=Alkalicoccobacillus gibsonii TaxID=79881 RepID=UPI003F7B9D38
MKPFDHYKQLTQHFEIQGTPRQIPTSLVDLEQVLFCSRRNVNFIMKKLRSLGWLEWKPGVGRSKQSYLIFHKTIQELQLEELQELFDQRQLKQMFSLIEELNLSDEWKDELYGWINSKLGFQQETDVDTKKDVLQFPYFREVGRLDPVHVFRQMEMHLIHQVFDGLTKRNSFSGEVYPHLAHSWEVNVELDKWVFHLRKRVYFHNGRELTSEDVKYTLKRLISGNQWMVSGLCVIRKLDRYTIALDFEKPCPLLLRYLALPQMVILQKTDNTHHTNPIGTGPFQIVDHQPELIELHAVDTYFKERPLLDIIRIWTFPSSIQWRKDAQFYPYVPSKGETYITTWSKNNRVDLERKVLICNTYKNGNMRSVQIRRRLKAAIDKEQMIKELGENRLCSCESLYDEEAKITYQAVPETTELISLTLYTNAHSLNVNDAAWLTRELRTNGFRLKVVTVPILELVQKRTRDKADLILVSMVNTSDLELSFIQFLLGHNEWFIHMFDSKQSEMLKSLAQVACLEQDPTDILKQIDDHLFQSVSIIPLYLTKQESYTHPNALGVELDDYGFLDYQKCWFQAPKIKEDHE